jgi:hypothetical protein
VVVGKSGAKSSAMMPYFHDIPPEFIRRVANRFGGGHIKYSPEVEMNLNYRQGLNDPTYVRDRLNHLFNHLLDFSENGNKYDDNLGAIGWCAAFLMEVERLAPEVFEQVIGQFNYFGKSAADFKKYLLKGKKKR